MSLLITGVRLADGSVTDLAVEQGRFVEPTDLSAPAERIDADGLLALPGLVDLHTHLREPGREDAETVASGTLAAARGGYTAVFAMPNLTPATDTGEAVVYLNELAARDAHCEVVPIGAVTKAREGEELAELGLMAAQGVTVFSDDGACVHDSLIMRRALTYLKPFGGVVAQHAQDPRLAGPSALLPRVGDLRAPRPARLADRRRIDHRRPRRATRRVHRRPLPRLSPLDRRERGGDPLGEEARHRCDR